MHFSEMTYTRPDLVKAQALAENAISELDQSQNAGEAEKALLNWDKAQGLLESQVAMARLKFAQNTQDTEAKSENDFLNANLPHFQVSENKFLERLVNSPHRVELEKQFGTHAFKSWEVALQSFDERISGLTAEESKLCMEYQQLMAQIRIPFEGKEYTLSNIGPIAQSSDRTIRRNVAFAIDKSMQGHQQKLDELYHQLVQIRHQMGLKMGRDNYTSLGYDMMGRTDYNADDVAVFRQDVIDYLVPVCQEIRARHAQRLDVQDYMHYDEALHHKEGEAVPKGDEQWMRQQAHHMFKDLGEDFSSFYSMMENQGLMDLDNRETKAGGGFCTAFYEHDVPFIFANFNGTNGDVRVFTHECGHAYQRYASRNQPLRSYLWPTLEACEIHSMSLEFFTYPQMHYFFKEDTNRFILSHLEGALLFIPYGCAVDAFQHWVYDNPSASSEDRAAEWKRLETVFLPWRRYESGETYYDSGRIWQRQRHIYLRPFYYIDYCLAQSCALQFWAQAESDREDALNRYQALCKLGGAHSFTKLLTFAGLQNPFQKGTLKSIITKVTQTLANLE